MIKQLMATASLAVSLSAYCLPDNSDYQDWNAMHGFMYQAIDGDSKIDTLIVGKNREYVLTNINNKTEIIRCVHKAITMQRVGCWNMWKK